MLLVAVVAMVGSGSSKGAEPGEKGRFVDACYERLRANDLSKVKDCFTDDFQMFGPESKLLGLSARGEALARMMAAGFAVDGSGWTTEFRLDDESEVGDTLWRQMTWIGRNPRGPYFGFTSLPPDLELQMPMLFKYTFRDGRIAEHSYMYDTVGALIDMAGGDYKAGVEKLLEIAPMIEQMRSASP